MAKLYANISIGHENDWQVLEKRIIAAAQCHSDAIVISKATPDITIPKNKKYVSINSKWGHLPYIDVAKRSEVDELNARKIKNYRGYRNTYNLEYYRYRGWCMGNRKYRLPRYKNTF